MFRRCCGVAGYGFVVVVLISVACAPRTDTTSGGRPEPAPVDGANEVPPWEQLPLARRPLFELPRFTLRDHSGGSYGSDDLDGCVWIASVIDAASEVDDPQVTAQLAVFQKLARRWPDWNRVRVVCVTADPERDSDATLRTCAAECSADVENWKFLTGTQSDLLAFVRNAFHSSLDLPASGANEVRPDFPLILVDAQSRIRGQYAVTEPRQFSQLLSDMRAVLAEPAPQVSSPLHIGLPGDVFAPPWLEQRQADQLASAGAMGMFHGFRYRDELERSGIRFVNRVVGDAARNWKPHHYDHGTGLAAADVDGDGLTDLYFVSQVGGNELWRNLGQGRFENVTASAGVGLADRVGVSAAFADIDNDGDPDLFVTTTRHGNALFVNDGAGRFRDITIEAGLEYRGHSSGADFFDYDRDGLVDLFVCNIGKFTTDEVAYSGDALRKESPYYVGIKNAFAGHLFPNLSERSILYHNEGGNRFRDVSAEMQLQHDKWSGDATPCDLNDDGWIDLYVVTMQGNDEYYENVQGQRFERRSAATFPRSPWGGMCAKTFDYNNDGRLDLFVSNMHADMWVRHPSDTGLDEKAKLPADFVPESILRSRAPGRNILGNAFFHNDGNGQFHEVSDRLNTETYWPWGHSVGDFNADGFQDLFITANMNLYYRYQVNSLLLNDGGTRFHDAEFILGVEPRRAGRTATPWFELDCSEADSGHKLCKGRTGQVVVWGALGSRSSAVVDLDQDGDLDIVTNDFNSPPMVLISDLSQRLTGLRYLSVFLRGTTSNRDGLGATVSVKAGDLVTTQVCDGQSGYLSQSSLPLYFGLGQAAVVDEITIRWPSGRVQVMIGPLETNRQLVIEEE